MTTTPKVKRLGSLLEDLRPMAEKVVAEIGKYDVAVWLDERAFVRFAMVTIAPNVDADSLVGTYSVGAVVDDVFDDLILTRDERFSTAIAFE